MKTNKRRSFLPTDEEFRAFHARGMTDAQIATATRVSPMTARAMRQARGLTEGSGVEIDPVRFWSNDDQFNHYWKAGDYDAKIAAKMGVTREAVRQWRMRHSPPLAPNPRRTVDPEVACMPLYIKGMDDKTIAAHTTLSVGQVRRWRHAHHLPAPSRFYTEVTERGERIVHREKPDYLTPYLKGWNDAEIAALYGRTPSAVQSWRGCQHPPLPPNVRGNPAWDHIHYPTAERRRRAA